MRELIFESLGRVAHMTEDIADALPKLALSTGIQNGNSPCLQVAPRMGLYDMVCYAVISFLFVAIYSKNKKPEFFIDSCSSATS